MVEMSPLSFAIAMKPEVFYDGQNEKSKKDIAAFLQTCIGKPMPDSEFCFPIGLSRPVLAVRRDIADLSQLALVQSLCQPRITPHWVRPLRPNPDGARLKAPGRVSAPSSPAHGR